MNYYKHMADLYDFTRRNAVPSPRGEGASHGLRTFANRIDRRSRCGHLCSLGTASPWIAGRTAVYHITHVETLSSIMAAGYCRDRRCAQEGITPVTSPTRVSRNSER